MNYIILDDFDQRTERWFEEKRGKISGSSWKGVYQEKGFTKDKLVAKLEEHNIEYEKNSKGGCAETIAQLMEKVTFEIEYELFKESDKKIGFYKILAERLFVPYEGEDARDRGERLEQMAAERFEKETGKKTSDVALIKSTENPDMVVSPDKVIYGKNKTIVEAVETKNFEDAHHVQAVIEQRIPDDIWPQLLQHFIVIDTLEKLHLVFHSDRTANEKLQYYCITINRKDIQPTINKHKTFELNALKLMDELVAEYAW